MACAPSEDSDQPGHLPSLISVFAFRMKKAWVLSYPLSAKRRLIRLGGCPGWSTLMRLGECPGWFAQADPSLRRSHSHFVGFVMRWLIFVLVLIPDLFEERVNIKATDLTYTPLSLVNLVSTVVIVCFHLQNEFLHIKLSQQSAIPDYQIIQEKILTFCRMFFFLLLF